MRDILWGEREVRTEKGNLYRISYYLLVESVRCGESILCENYVVKLCVEQEGVSDVVSVPGITTCAGAVGGLLALLERNGVTAVSLRDVLDDWLASA
jgi:hypothetical protein